MKTWMGCIAAISLCATSAWAGEEDWSIGAGIGYGYGFSSAQLATASSGSSVGVGYLTVQTFTPVVSVERRLAAGTWLLLGAEGEYSTSSVPVQPQISNLTFTSTKQGGFALAAGVRQYLNDPGAVIGVSLQAAVDAGIASISTDLTNSDGNGNITTSHASSTAWSVGAVGGFALDRHLLDQLSVRLAVQLLSAAYQKTTTSPSSTVQGAGSSFSASLIFSPDIELRFAF